MKKRYLFGLLVAALAVGLVFTACELFETEEDDDDPPETYSNLVITGQDSLGKVVKTTFSTDRTVKAVLGYDTLKEGDSYEIQYDNNTTPVSKGKIEVSGTSPKTVKFIPSSGDSFNGNLTTANVLSFPDGIPRSGGNITHIVDDKATASSAITPEFETNGDLDNTTQITLKIGNSIDLEVTVKATSGNVSYQWFRGGTPQSNYTGTAITGATQKDYTVTATAAGTTNYYVRVAKTSGEFFFSKIVSVVVPASPASTEIKVGESGRVRIGVLPDVISYMLGNDPDSSVPYTVIFEEDLKNPLFISPDTFPGTGTVTIKATVELTKGIHIARSNVVLEGVNIMVNSLTGDPLPKYEDSSLCGVMVSNRYKAYKDAISEEDIQAKNLAESLAEYDALHNDNKTINNVEINNCTIIINGSSGSKLLGICIDPYTVGTAAANRVKVNSTVVTVANITDGRTGRAFFGNYAVLTGNTFTASKEAVHISFILKLEPDTISFANNRFITTNTNSVVAMVDANNWINLSTTERGTKQESIWTETNKFGSDEHQYTLLENKYKNLIESLFDQFPNPVGKVLKLVDFYWIDPTPALTPSRATGTKYNEGEGDAPATYDTTFYRLTTANPKAFEKKLKDPWP